MLLRGCEMGTCAGAVSKDTDSVAGLISSHQREVEVIVNEINNKKRDRGLAAILVLSKQELGTIGKATTHTEENSPAQAIWFFHHHHTHGMQRNSHVQPIKDPILRPSRSLRLVLPLIQAHANGSHEHQIYPRRAVDVVGLAIRH